jgi:hypothetical protein
MKKLLIILLTLSSCILNSTAQSITAPTYVDRAKKLLTAFPEDKLAIMHFPFKDTLRTHWERLPGQRTGLKLSYFTDEQKIAYMN